MVDFSPGQATIHQYLPRAELSGQSTDSKEWSNPQFWSFFEQLQAAITASAWTRNGYAF
jgi:hypothetical protein